MTPLIYFVGFLMLLNGLLVATGAVSTAREWEAAAWAMAGMWAFLAGAMNDE